MSVDIGKIAVTFAANTEGFTRGVGSATSALMDFAKRSQDASSVLMGGFSANFGSTIDALTEKLKIAALSGDAFGESVASAMEKAAKRIDGGLAASFDTMSKEMEVGLVTSEQFAESFGELSQRAQSSIDAVAGESLESLKAALDSAQMSAAEFAEAVAQVAAGEAGAGLDQTRNATAMLTKALGEGVVGGQEFLSMLQAVSSAANQNAIQKQAEAVGLIHEQFDRGRLTADEYANQLRSIQLSFRVEAAGEYEAQINALSAAQKNLTISTEEFDQQHKILRATLEQRFIGELEAQLNALPEAYEAAGRSAEELADAQELVNAQIAAGRDAARRVADRADDAAASGRGTGGGDPGGIMNGLETAGRVLSIIPGEIGNAGSMIENILSVSRAASSALGGLGGAFASLTNPMSLVIGATIVAGGAMLRLASEFGRAAQESQNLATQFGATLREVAVLQSVLSAAGSSMSEFQKANRFLQQSLSRASDGALKAGAAFRRLGIDSKELRFEDTQTQFREVALALARIENPAERASLAMQLLGKQGPQFLAKLGKNASDIQKSFEEAEQEVQRFKTAFTEFDAAQLIKAKKDIHGIADASNGLAKSIAEALAPLASGAGSAIADTIGAITNVIVALSPPIKVLGAAIGEVLRIVGSLVNTLARVFAAGFANIWTSLDALFKGMTGGIGIIELMQKAASDLVGLFQAVATWTEKIAVEFEAWTTGKTVEELEQIKKQQREAAALGEAAAQIQEKYGDKTESIREKIAEVNKLRATMGGDGKPLISADEAAAALNDLDEQLKKASPHIAMMTAENEKFEQTMKRASKEAADMGNNIAQGARANYFEHYKSLLDQLKNNKISKEVFDKSLEGLAEKFDREMEKAKPIKAISDQIEELAKKYNQKTGAAGAIEDFANFKRARDAGGTFVGQEEAARLQRIDEFGSGMGLDLKPKLEGFALYQSRMEEINQLHREAAKTTQNALEEERKFNQLRAATTKQLLGEIEKSVKAIGARKEGPMEKFVKDSQTLDAAYNEAKAARDAAARNADANGVTAAERQMRDISERRARNASQMANTYRFEGEGERAVREFDEQMADIRRARAGLGVVANMAGTPEALALNEAERAARDKFNKENIDAIDRAMFGSNRDTRAATGIDATSQEGVSTYFRIQREDHSVTKRQLEEARQSRILLQKIADNGGLSGAAAL